MFDIGWSEMAIIMLLALIIIGPKDLPRVARTIGQWVRKGRMLAREFQNSLEDMAKEADLDDVKKEIEKVGKTDLKKTVENTIDPKGDLKKAFDTSDGASGEDTVGKALIGGAETKAEDASPASVKAAAPAKGNASSSAKPKTEVPAKKPAAAARKATSPAKTTPKAKTAATAKKPATARKPAAAKKPAAPRKPAAKRGASTKSGGEPSAADDGGAAMAAKSS